MATICERCRLMSDGCNNCNSFGYSNYQCNNFSPYWTDNHRFTVTVDSNNKLRMLNATPVVNPMIAVIESMQQEKPDA